MAMATGTKIRTIKVGKQFRSFTILRGAIDKDRREVELSFSSEEPVERWWGNEILDHSESSVDLRRLKRGGALLIDHDMRNQVGVIEEVSVDSADRKGRARVRFGRSAKAQEIFDDVVDGIRSNVSVGYQILDMVLEREEKDGPSTYRVNRWEPFEISLVAVPADINVGVGRNGDEDGREIEIKIPEKESKRMEKCACGADLVNGKCQACEERAKREAEDKQKRELELKNAREESNKRSVEEMEKGRINAIKNLCKINRIDNRFQEMWVRDGYSIEEVSDQMLKILEERGNTKPEPLSKIGLTNRETERFSLRRAINAMINKDWSNAPFELEASKAVAQKLGRLNEPTKFFVPFEVLERPIDIEAVRAMRAQRDLTAGTAGAGGYLVGTDNMGFIEMLRNRSVAFRMGARRLSGLVGNLTIPRQSAAATAYWLSTEATDTTESQQTFVQVSLSPKNVAAYTEISRQLLLQSSPGAEGIVADDLAQVVATAADLGALEGTGSSGQPTGISATSGIGSVTGTSLAAAGIIEFMTDVAGSNVTPVAPGYVTTPAVAGLLMARPELPTTGTTRLWKGSLWNGTLFDMPAMSTAQVTAATMIFGDWQELVIGEWGVLEVEVNPYAGFQAGIVGVRAIYSMDVGVRRPFAFSRATTIT